MNRRVIIVFVGACLALAGILFFLLGYGEQQISVSFSQDGSTEVLGVDIIDTIRVTHVYSSGVHTYSGEIPFPTPCYVLGHSVEISSSVPEDVVIGFTAENKADACAQVVAMEPFSVTFNAGRDARVRTTLNGSDLPFRIVGETVMNDQVAEEVSSDGSDDDEQATSLDDGTTTDETTQQEIVATTTEGVE